MLLINRIFSNNISIWIFSLLMIVLAIVLHKNTKKKFLYLLPIAVGVIHFIFFSFKGDFYHTKYYYGVFYIALIVMVLSLFIGCFPRIKKIVLPIVTTFCILAGVHTVVQPMVFNSAMRNHTRQGYVKSFISATKDMEKYYSLKDWKKIDMQALREKFLPVMERAEETQDAGLFAAATVAFGYNFHDGHVIVTVPVYDPWIRCLELLSGNDYGLSMIRLDDGKTVAVNVEEDSPAWKNGIRNKTVITSWNGQPIDEAIEGTEFIYVSFTIPVKATEDMFKPIMLATKGMRKNGEKGIIGDLIQNASITDDSQRPHALVGYIDENGDEKELELEALGCGLDRFEMTYLFLDLVEYIQFPDINNLETVMLNDDTAYMARWSETSSTFYDVLSYFTNRNSKVRNMLIDELTQMKNQGMKKLIIDARSNTGGFWSIGIETASLFTNEPFDIAKRGSNVFGKKKIISTVTVPADGRFSDIEVLMLVNHYCVSSGDLLVKMLKKCPNVTVMGLSPSNCSCQEVGGISFLSDSICNIRYPVNWLYEVDEETRCIDTDETRECTLPLDVKVPLTYDLAKSMYDDRKTRDVLLDYALDYLNTNEEK
ncbi:MAG: hypothetical protein IKQ43_03480 [Treponema sp.]|nr:hypothetical protein [Treponema sp.]